MRKAIRCAALSCALGLAESKALKWNQPDARWEPAQQTGLAYMESLGVSPVPTTAPHVKPRADILGRAAPDNTCGYISGSSDASLSCARTQECIYNSVNSHIGCCDDTATTVCNAWTTCYDSTERAQYTTNNGLSMWCGDSKYPHCTTYIYQDKVFKGYTLFGCAVAGGTGQLWYTPLDVSTSTSTTTTSSSAASTTSEISSSEEPVSSSTATPTPPPTPDDDDDSGPPIGPIVGGVVGGLGAIALIILGIWALKRHSNKQKIKAAEATAAAAAATAPTQQTQPPPGPDPQDPRMSQVPPPGPHGYYDPSGAGAGFTPLGDPRASIAKPPIYTGTPSTLYDPNAASVMGTSPPHSPSQSPPPAFQPHHTPSPPPAAYGHPQGGYGQQPQGDYQQQQYGNVPPGGAAAYGGQPPQQQGGYPPHQQQAGAYGAPAHGGGNQFAAELPAFRGDGEVRELQG